MNAAWISRQSEAHPGTGVAPEVNLTKRVSPDTLTTLHPELFIRCQKWLLKC